MSKYHNAPIFYIILALVSVIAFVKTAKTDSFVLLVNDPKEFKKILRTRTNVLAVYSAGRLKSELNNVFREVANELRGTATLIHVDCGGDGKKLCKKLKAEPSPHLLRHYKDGEYHKDYDRRLSIPSMVAFLRDPGGDLPWDEDENGTDVVHVTDMNALNRLLKKERSFMMMFYAPWCGFCKRLKPDYSAAASELRGTHVMVAMDVNKPENAAARGKYNITGFPTLVYFENGLPKFVYEGDNNKEGLVAFVKNPTKAPEKPKEEDWASEEPSEVVHLTDASFHEFVKISAYLAALDATKETKVAAEFGVKGYPSVKYFKDGQFLFDVSTARDHEKIVQFMTDPKEPPPPPPPEKAWAESESSVVHLNDESFKSFLKKKRHVLVMFYAPWCGHCKKAKPEFTAAADKFADDPRAEFAAIDCTLHQSLCTNYEVRGYPTFVYYNYLKNSRVYTGGRMETDFIRFMENPENPGSAASSPPPPPAASPQEQWDGHPGAEFLHHLTEDDFTEVLKGRDALVMFYAPWCGHCKSMKGDYSKAAAQLATDGSHSILATVDATVQTALGNRYDVRGYPSLRFFRDGRETEAYEGGRSAMELVEWVKEREKGGQSGGKNVKEEL